ncbi:hypothetical protein BDV95DRAFT_601698 [Massariosphaeria phaeospora]|uniref:DUF1774-domain-containing protein n=1 Tax=Massariosphaeria phaeospora TaxID=100035 RepID=A0A7C8IE11_9PLEO|nr:hypothetical protein BDV95DRAFT_601698 [Massariosphaeria phaeospora]
MPENGVTTSAGDSEGHWLNPFARRTHHSATTILIYKILTPLTYILLVATSILYTFHAPAPSSSDHVKHGKHGKHGKHSPSVHHTHPAHTIFGQNAPTPFAQNSIITSLYWLALFLLQPFYLAALYRSSNPAWLHPALNLASHYIAHNLLLFGFLHLWTRSHFWLAELLLVLNFANLSIAYFRHSTSPRVLHVGVLAGPLAWTFVGLYWVGARAVGSDALPARIVANVFIWGYLAYGVFFLVAFKDYTMGFALSVLSFSTGVGQFLTNIPILHIQWIFAFTIGALLFTLSVLVGVPSLLGRDPVARGAVVDQDRERAPLLDDE